MEIPDVIVVNKCDHPLADTMIREVGRCSRWGRKRAWRVPVVTEATKARGSRSWSRRSTATGAHITEEGTLVERRPATSGPRCSGSPPRGCAASSRSGRERPRVGRTARAGHQPRDRIPATAARELLELRPARPRSYRAARVGGEPSAAVSQMRDQPSENDSASAKASLRRELVRLAVEAADQIGDARGPVGRPRRERGELIASVALQLQLSPSPSIPVVGKAHPSSEV